MRTKVTWLAGFMMVALGLAFVGAPLAQTTTAVEVRNFEVILVDGNKLVVRNEKGTQEITVPADFQFTVDGKKMSVSELKPGMKGTATITTTTTIKPVVVTEVREGEVLRAQRTAMDVRTADGVRRFTQGQLDAAGVRIVKDGRPVRIEDVRRGDKLTALIITEGAPMVLTEKEVLATLADSKVDPASIQALRDMGAFLQSLKRFHVETEASGERVLADGQKLQHTATAKMDVDRPNKIRALIQTARSAREIIYDGKTVTLYTPAQKYYSTVEITETIGGLINKLEERYAIQLPLQDLFLFGTPAAALDKIESAMNAGQDFIDDHLCDHYAFRQGKIDWQIWIATGSQPLPRKIVITNRADEARPQSVSLIDWNLKPTFKDTVFKFMPPKGATKIEIVPVKAK